ncbi:flagellar biosynthetic protein FliR [Roseicyclus mahoneyensis]|uniref:Flagellar biosynthetic protein FliR n=1 Tax=Roseicyclus mahoneyensis TaxID=164332 RepID=A0A316GIP6_9RHOB|nr:flagellar biosynthetic protein FliR [Roseicyclus mahoneyensis]PWK60404.1 flagellar biosynthetic protein FliR [Roseicyclus mahoneyensis]
METAATALPGLALAEVTGALLQGLFAMLRIGAFVIAAPLFAARFVPLPVRIIIAVVLTIPVVTTVEMPAPEVLASLSVVPMIAVELALGLAAGLVLQILFSAATMAGDWIAATAGLSFAAQMDPNTGGQSPVVAQLLFLLLLGLFLAEDGHLAAIRLVIQSYAVIPPGGTIAPGALTGAGMSAAGLLFETAAALMLPVVSILLIVNIIIGVITRSAPQMNLFSFGFPLMLTTAIGLLFLTVPSLGHAMASLFPRALDLMASFLIGGGVSDG